MHNQAQVLLKRSCTLGNLVNTQIKGITLLCTEKKYLCQLRLNGFIYIYIYIKRCSSRRNVSFSHYKSRGAIYFISRFEVNGRVVQNLGCIYFKLKQTGYISVSIKVPY